MINCEIKLDLTWMEDFIISQLWRTAAVAANLPNLDRETTQTTCAKFQINNAKFYVLVITQSINNNLDYMIDPPFRNINRLFFISFRNGHHDTKRNLTH